MDWPGGEACEQNTRSLALSCGFVPRGVREVQPLDSGQASKLGSAVVAAGGQQRGVAHEALHLDGVDTGVEQVGGEGPPPVVGTEVANAGGPGPAVDEGIDRLGGEPADGDSAGLVHRAEQRSRVEAPDLEPGGHRPATAGGERCAALAAALAGDGEVAVADVVDVDVEGDHLGPA